MQPPVIIALALGVLLTLAIGQVAVQLYFARRLRDASLPRWHSALSSRDFDPKEVEVKGLLKAGIAFHLKGRLAGRRTDIVAHRRMFGRFVESWFPTVIVQIEVSSDLRALPARRGATLWEISDDSYLTFARSLALALGIVERIDVHPHQPRLCVAPADTDALPLLAALAEHGDLWVRERYVTLVTRPGSRGVLSEKEIVSGLEGVVRALGGEADS